MEVKILSKEMIRPSSSSTTSLLQPYELCLFDQLTPSTYVGVILFYLNFPENSTHLLKSSLSQALDLFYPFSGRIRNNLIVDRFDAAVLFLQAHVSSAMAEFLERFDDEAELNQLIPFRSFYKEPQVEEDDSPIIAFQVNQFSCGGTAIGISYCHKLCDGTTVRLLLKSWAAIAGGSCCSEVQRPNLDDLSSLFPPRQSLPQNQVDLMDRFWFKEAGDDNTNVTRRFLFSHEAIAALKAKAKSKSFRNPSRILTLTGFIWKHATAALKNTQDSPEKKTKKRKPVLAVVMNMRPRMNPDVSDEAMGNPIWWATATTNPTKATAVELHQVVGEVKEAMAGFDSEDLEGSGTKERIETVWKNYLKKLEDQMKCDNDSEKIVVLAFSSWITLFQDVDFGWGVPFWITPAGKWGPEFSNMTVFTETKGGGGIEAWVTMDEKIMKVLEDDTEFLAFTSNFNKVISAL